MSVVDGFRVALTLGATANLSSYYVLPAGGTQPRQLQALFADRVNVKDFGATANGSSNDTAAIQAAINYAAANAKAVWFPAGNYSVGTLTWAPNVPLIGDGQLSSILYSRSASQTILSYTATADRIMGSISGLGFIAGTNLGKAISVRGTNASARASYLTIQDCYFGSFATAVDLYLCANVFLINLTALVSAVGYSIDTCADVDAVNCRAQLGSGYGFVVSDVGGFGASGEGVRLLNCTTNGQAGGLSITNQNWGSAAGCSFTTTTQTAVTIVNGSAWKFTNCEFASSVVTVNGVTVDAASDNIQIANSFFALSQTGLVLGGTQMTVVGNSFTGNAVNDIGITGTKCIVSNNNCLSPVANIVESGSANYNIIGQNIVDVSVTAIGANTITPNNLVA